MQVFKREKKRDPREGLDSLIQASIIQFQQHGSTAKRRRLATIGALSLMMRFQRNRLGSSAIHTLPCSQLSLPLYVKMSHIPRSAGFAGSLVMLRCLSSGARARQTPFPAPFFEMRLNRYFRPCRCDGSIRYVHEACLEQWISRKRTSHCEVCTYPIRFEQVVQGSTGQGLRLRLFSNYVF